MTRTHLMRCSGGRLLPGVIACCVILAGCDVTNPGRILDEDLNNELTFRALVTGMSSDFSEGFMDLNFTMARANDEITGSGSYFTTGLVRIGIFERDDMNDQWGSMHRARWVAESGLERMREAMDDATFNASPLTARAYLLAAFAHRALGECACYAVIDGSGVLSHEVHFDSAVARADEAIRIGQAVGESDIVTAAYGVRAQANMHLRNWAAAAADANRIATDFEYIAYYDANSGRENNTVYVETHQRAEMSVYGTYAATLNPPVNPATDLGGDPRAPWFDCTDAANRPADCNSHQGADGLTPHYMQRKYDNLGADVPLVKGTEMRLIEAEAELNGTANLGTFVGLVNQARSHYGLAPLATPATANDAWIMLDNERQLTLWLEVRRQADARRWDEDGRAFMPAVQYIMGLTATPYEKDPGIAKRMTCVPISFDECSTNPNLAGAPECEGNY